MTPPDATKPKEGELNEHVAWLRYKTHDGGRVTIHVCGSDSPGAFKVYRRPASASDAQRARDDDDDWDLENSIGANIVRAANSPASASDAPAAATPAVCDTECVYCRSLNGGHTAACQAIHREPPSQVARGTGQQPDEVGRNDR